MLRRPPLTLLVLLPGLAGYLAAALRTLRRWRAPHVHLVAFTLVADTDTEEDREGLYEWVTTNYDVIAQKFPPSFTSA